MINEMALRGPDFDEASSEPVEFPAGTFFLPKPVTRMRPVFRGGKAEGRKVVTTDPEFNALLAAVEEEDSYLSIADLAAFLIGKNYPGITDEQLGEVLEYDPADESPDRWPMRVLAVAYGRTGPKPDSAI